ncbi:MAG: bifunctional [glutamine synthetase] adenylyltransferase/[glutamine synthetase]-adenylyl-L-tyrosine phosphorylase [Alphaproteobacteria bacterium]|nr:bifunctional [glutamine synthetase] adenylyltransferase/[glutamine synthetase]-adenylyl-L-tyrosine phosphorylase [Alphaproteobacteria bacterium]
MVSTHSDSTLHLPAASNERDAAHLWETLSSTFAAPMAHKAAKPLLQASAGNSPYISRLIQKYPDVFFSGLTHGYSEEAQRIVAAIAEPTDDLMKHLRISKAQISLAVALGDISGEMSLQNVTALLSTCAERCVQTALNHLLSAAAKRGEFAPKHMDNPSLESGIIILGMGKLGALELNYSSDIDLIILYEKEQLPYTGQRNAQIFMNKIAQDLVTLLQERTQDGYVFRTDLRLRPDPMSTPPAVTVGSALTYYETVGQNWERAAMIKARPIAGDVVAGERFLSELVPYIWRKSLDFATIADIHSIKRQMNVSHGKTITLEGHNIKTGMGGIREIEFFVQTQQLVWGGRIPTLRVQSTLDALDKLVEAELVAPATRERLHQHYVYLRNLEHRLQMRNDEQTHTLPDTDDGMEWLRIFLNYNSQQDLRSYCLDVLNEVHRIYSESMQGSEPLAVDGNLVFTGVEADPETLKTLERMGYKEARRISDIIQGWHRGHRRSTRSKRSRQVLTELIPAVLTALSKTAQPDTAFFHFDDFIDKLPSGAQIFTLFNTRPELLELLADILGSAPALGDTLSKDPGLLESVLEADFFQPLPSKTQLAALLHERIAYTQNYEQRMGYLRLYNNEKRFQAGVHLLKKLAKPLDIGCFLSDLADVIVQTTINSVLDAYAEDVPDIRTLSFAALALGKLGSREMTFGSDLDLVFVYDDEGDAASEMRAHVQRVSQRLVSALTLLTREGRLYEVDTRLRPGGSDGPIAVSLKAFDAYFTNSAWTYEHMALTKARIIAHHGTSFVETLGTVIRSHICKARDHNVLLTDVREMRERIAKEHRTTNPWHLKHHRGGMVDIDFIAQYLCLREALAHPSVWHAQAEAVLQEAANLRVIDAQKANDLIQAKLFLSDLLSYLRLTWEAGIITDDAPSGLKRLLTAAMGANDFDALKARVMEVEARVRALWDELLPTA